MNEININPDRIKNAELISQKNSPIALYRMATISFGLVDTNTGDLLFAFASPNLTRYLEQEQNLNISNASIIKRVTLVGTQEHERHELLLQTDDGGFIMVNQYDHIFECKPGLKDLPAGPTICSPHKEWGLPPEYPYASMMLTERLVHLINDISNEGQQQSLVHILWLDYKLERQRHLFPDEHLIVEGEFVVFQAKQFRIKPELVVFDLI